MLWELQERAPEPLLDALGPLCHNGRMKTKRRRERSIGSAIGLSVLTAVIVGLGLGVALLLVHFSGPRILYDLIGSNRSGEMEKSPLFIELNYNRAYDDVIVTGIASLVSGLVLGKIAPIRLSLGKKLGASALSAFLFIGIFILGFQWAVKIISQQGKVYPQQISAAYIRYQGTAVAVWFGLTLVGTGIGSALAVRKNSPGPAEAPKAKAVA